ncbi:hypothetical protein Pla52n_36060 [Stieleria varia]|uniref:Uncharacterized protein n=1 Tax=Stieleria varia TaxID=2528005 RepID=A0A5C6AU30_9BACT|nr:hypothetical protein Pla52n_36060 [Stieleria varia]
MHLCPIAVQKNRGEQALVHLKVYNKRRPVKVPFEIHYYTTRRF